MYDERAVFFLDLLGFGNKVEEAVNNPSIMTKIRACLDLIASFPDGNKQNSSHFLISLLKQGGLPESDLQVLTFSDSLVVSVSCKQPEAVVMLLRVIQHVQHELLQAGLLSRGGASVGKLVHEPNGIMFGPAFNMAYHLESKLAKNPRVLIDQSYMDYFAKTGFDKQELIESGFIKAFPDGPYGLDSYFWVYELMKKGAIGPLKLVLSQIIDEIDKNRYVPSAYSKLVWHKKQIEVAIKSSDNYQGFVEQLPV